MKLVAKFPVLGMTPVPWSVPNIGNATNKAGKRYRFTTRNKELESWQAYVKSVAEDYMADGGRAISLGPLFAKAAFGFRADDPALVGKPWAPAISWNEKKGKWVKKGGACPDCDNLFKSTMDALHGVVFGDDAQVCVQGSSRRWQKQEGVYISIWEFDEDEGWDVAHGTDTRA